MQTFLSALLCGVEDSRTNLLFIAHKTSELAKNSPHAIEKKRFIIGMTKK